MSHGLPDYVKKISAITIRLSELCADGEQLDFSEDVLKMGLLAVAACEGYIVLSQEGLKAIQSQESVFVELDSEYE